MLPELSGRAPPQTRMGAHVVEVLEGRRQLRHDRRGIRQVHAADVVALEGVDGALGHATAHGRGHRLEAQ